MKKENLDFFKMGQRRATQTTSELSKLANEIEEIFGVDARLEFESGIAITIASQYNRIYKEYNTSIKEGYIEGTTDYGKNNMRNNSYFGSNGTSKQYILKKVDGTEVSIYNEPKKNIKKEY